MSEEIYKECLRKVFDYVDNNTMNNSKKEIGYIVSGCIAANPQESLKLFVPKIYKDVFDTKTGGKFSRSFSNLNFEKKLCETDGILEYKELSDTEFEWKLSVLSAVVDHGGVHLLPYK